MGYALAIAAEQQGHSVTLVSGPVHLPAPENVDVIFVETAQEMWEVVGKYLPAMDVGIFAAAVADHRPANPASQKIKKTDGSLTIELERTPDILGSARSVLGFGGILVGFAAETENVLDHAMEKLIKKGCDLMVANDVSLPGVGFDADDNSAILLYPDGSHVEFQKCSKRVLGGKIMDAVVELSVKMDSNS
jgi:phosphopantothenoylcysteine synthetase/decarboxylase